MATEMTAVAANTELPQGTRKIARRAVNGAPILQPEDRAVARALKRAGYVFGGWRTQHGRTARGWVLVPQENASIEVTQ